MSGGGLTFGHVGDGSSSQWEGHLVVLALFSVVKVVRCGDEGPHKSGGGSLNDPLAGDNLGTRYPATGMFHVTVTGSHHCGDWLSRLTRARLPPAMDGAACMGPSVSDFGAGNACCLMLTPHVSLKPSETAVSSQGLLACVPQTLRTPQMNGFTGVSTGREISAQRQCLRSCCDTESIPPAMQPLPRRTSVTWDLGVHRPG